MEEHTTRPLDDVAEPAAPAKRSFLSELPVLVIVAFVLALVLKTFLVQAFYIPSSSMEPTLQIGDRVLVNKLAHTFREPRRGEIVVFSVDGGTPAMVEPANPVVRFLRGLASGLGMAPASDRDFIKRVIGLPGDVVEMRDGVVTVNGVALPEAPASEGGYLSERHMEPFGPFTVPEGHYFMMGDNRPNSSDSRYSLGPIAEDRIVGRAFVIIWPLSHAGMLTLPDYGEIPVVG
ncbi:MAG TPA: signal peptidase I, partial [Egibacteraceae bacterium]|nr:signal peptidase I [Egibacteraceae bacterium]